MRTVTVPGGQTAQIRSKLQYVVVSFRREPLRTADGVYIPYAIAMQGSGSLAIATKAANRHAHPEMAIETIVFDQTAGSIV